MILWRDFGKKEERQMKLTNQKWFSAGGWMGLLSLVMCMMGVLPGQAADAQAMSTTTVQGTVYLANGQPGTGTLVVSWPSFTTASGQLVTADSTTVAIAPDGFVSVSLAPNQGATPAGLYYTAVYYMSDGSTNTQYWVIPEGAQATLGQVQAQVMPSSQAVQAVNQAYVNQAIAGLSESLLTASGGTLTGPLTLCCDPTQPMQAADKHYADEQSALAVPLTGATMTGPLTSVELGALYQVDQFPGADFGAKRDQLRDRRAHRLRYPHTRLEARCEHIRRRDPVLFRPKSRAEGPVRQSGLGTAFRDL